MNQDGRGTSESHLSTDAEVCARVADACAMLRRLTAQPRFAEIDRLIEAAAAEAERVRADLRGSTPQ